MRASHVYPANTPSAYAAGKLRTLRGWWNSPISGGGPTPPGAIVRRMLPVFFPGVPPEVHLGFASNGGWHEDTAFAQDHAPFHEVGGYGSSGGPWNVPFPNSNTSVENEWYRTHDDDAVVRMLGRSASMGPFETGRNSINIPLEDQIAIGINSIRTHADAANRSLPASIRYADPNSLWATALGFIGWSAGAGRAAHQIAPYADRLAQVPEHQRWDAYLYHLAQDVQAGRVPYGTDQYDNPAYGATRTQQKLMAGRELALNTGGNVAWFGAHDVAVEDTLARACGNGPAPSGNLGSFSAPGAPPVTAGSLTGGVAGAVPSGAGMALAGAAALLVLVAAVYFWPTKPTTTPKGRR